MGEKKGQVLISNNGLTSNKKKRAERIGVCGVFPYQDFENSSYVNRKTPGIHFINLRVERK